MVESLQFEVPSVRIDNDVWMWLAKEKLNTMKLSTDAVIDKLEVGFEQFSGRPRMVLSHADSPNLELYTSVLRNVNTATEFRELDRKGMFEALRLMSAGSLLRSPVFVVSFADLKSYTFTYNVALPSVSPEEYDFECCEILRSPSPSPAVPLSTRILVRSADGSESAFSPASVVDGDILVVSDRNFASDSNHLPFYVRRYLTSIAVSISEPISVSLELNGVVSFRGVSVRPAKSVKIISSWVKWTNLSTLQPTTMQSIDLKRFMDPATVAAEAVQLNVKLIKWRLIPGIEPEKFSSLKFLLVGAGTLGCAVARCLLSWGVNDITLVDSGRVSYSNPARQWLFRLEDAVANAPKAATGAARLKEILPSVNARGVELSVPLPGHPSDLTLLEENFSHLKNLVNSHDVVFMLTDSRESRWLPSLLVAAASADPSNVNPPLGVSVALGFDSYLVKIQSYQSVKSSCYFCNDVNAPTDQTSFRTLDQQCTVTRPGVAAIASCMAVELIASLSQAEGGFATPRTVQDTGLLGAVPDQVRGFLGSMQSFPAVTDPFNCCICCSDRVVGEFRERGIEFVKEVVKDSGKLMAVSGLESFVANTDSADLWHLDDDVE